MMKIVTQKMLARQGLAVFGAYFTFLRDIFSVPGCDSVTEC
jgi:hypothetical protein